MTVRTSLFWPEHSASPAELPCSEPKLKCSRSLGRRTRPQAGKGQTARRLALWPAALPEEPRQHSDVCAVDEAVRRVHGRDVAPGRRLRRDRLTKRAGNNRNVGAV